MVRLMDLFWIFFKINSLTFGGGYTIVAVISDEMIEKRGWLSQEDMVSIVTLAQSGPGAMAISTSLLTGYRLRGFKGAIVGLVASVLPCIIIITGLYYVYDSVKDSAYVQRLLEGLSGVIGAVLLVTVAKMFLAVYKDMPVYAILAGSISFLLAFVFKVHTLFILLAGGLIGYLVVMVSTSKRGKA